MTTNSYDASRRMAEAAGSRVAIRAYGKSELAMLYFPGSQPRTALNHLMAWIKRCRPLMAELDGMGYRTSDKWFTPRHVSAIVSHLGEP